MNSTRTLLIVAATSCIAIGSSAQAGQLLTAEDIVEAVRFRGPDSVMREMIKENIPVDLLVAGVASGKANWMAAAQALMPAVDGEVAQNLAIGLMVALPKAPYRALTLAESAGKSPFTNICYRSLVYMSGGLPGGPKQYTSRLELALAGPSPSGMSAQRSECLVDIAKAKFEL